MSFLKKLYSELAQNGKLLVGYVLAQLPLSDFPGLKDAVDAVLANPSDKSALFNLLVQAVFALGAGHRLVKILRAVL